MSRKGWRKLTRKDLPGFDDYAVKAIQLAMDAGGTGKVSNRGHVMIKSPDGRIMGVVADTRKARQVIAIGLRDLFGVHDLHSSSTKIPNQRQTTPSSEPDLEESPVTKLSGGHACWDPDCSETFVTEGAVYSHAHTRHHVCPHPGCTFTRSNRSRTVAHFNTKHGEHPRAKAARLRREEAEQVAAEALEPAAEVSETNHPPVEAPHDERAREHATPQVIWAPSPEELTDLLRRLEKHLDERHGLEERVVRLEAENAALRAKLEVIAQIARGEGS